MQAETKQVLVTVKAYPNPSAKYGETVCCAGVDLDDHRWVRLYPIPYRDLDNDQKFKKYSIIRAKCSKPVRDKRGESFRIDSDSIEVVRWLDPKKKNGWEERKSIVLQLPVISMCKLHQNATTPYYSLGLIRPQNISFEWKKRNPSDSDARKACYTQLSFFDKKKKAIEHIPYVFYYRFYCDGEPDCQGHRLSIVDWEIGQAYRDWRRNYPSKKVLLEKIEQRWLTISDTAKRDVYYYVGNMKRFPKNFMVLGVFCPPKPIP